MRRRPQAPYLTYERPLVHRSIRSSRYRSEVTRSVLKVGDQCPACLANEDPNKVPVHPNCNCEVITTSLNIGVEPERFKPIERWIREAGKLTFVQGNEPESFELEEMQFEPATVAILDAETARHSDTEAWLLEVEEWLTAGGLAISTIVRDVDLVLSVLRAR